MSYRKIMALLLVLTPVLVFGQTALTANISGPAGSAFETGQAIEFVATAEGGEAPYSYVWNFGDGDGAAGDGFSKTYSTAGTYTVSLTVNDFGGNSVTAEKSVTITEPTPSVPLASAITFPANNAAFDVGQAINFQASAEGGEAPYSYVWNFGDGEGAAGDGFSKTYTTAGTYTVSLTVNDFGGASNTDTISIVINPVTPPTGQPTVILKANNQDGALSLPTNATASTTVSLTWTTTNSTTCVASGDWSGAKATNGSESVVLPPSATALARAYTLTCAGDGGSTSDTVTVSLSGGTATSLVITNVRITDIAQTSVVVRWTTNLPASSRVIYDTVSHSTIDSNNTPNYGYQFSTGTDGALVTEHAMTVSGLTAATQYFFRVISEN